MAEKEEYNYILVVGKDEMAANSVDVRTRERGRLGKFQITKLIEFFRNLAPPKSAKENKIIEDMFKEDENSENQEMQMLEDKLKNKLFLNGMEISDEDKSMWEKYSKEVISADSYPNLFKWKKIMELSMK